MIMQRTMARARFADAARRFASDRSGATVIEYGLILAFIGAVLVTGMSLIGGWITDVFGRISAAVSS